MSDELALGYAMGQDSGNNNCGGMWGGDNWILGLAALGLVFGGGMFGGGMFGGGMWGNGGANGAVTRAELSDGFNFNNLDSAVRGVQQGLCDGFYAMNTSILNTNANISKAVCDLGYATQQSFNTTNVALMQGFNGVQAGQNAISNQLASCCCETQRLIERGFCDTNYALATNTNSIIQNQHNDTDRVIAKLDQMENTRQAERIAALQLENQGLKFAASQERQNNYLTSAICGQTAELVQRIAPTPVPSYTVPAPYPYCVSGYGYDRSGCGCGC